jgi:hypothetical protein
MIDLIDLDRARQNIPTAVNTDEPVISTLITAASRACRKYCRRDFTQTTYDELYSEPATVGYSCASLRSSA